MFARPISVASGRLVERLLVPLVFVGSLGLVGCSSQNESAEPVETEIQSIATEVVTEAPTEEFTIPPDEELYPSGKPEFPEGADERSQVGAVLFAAYFWESYAYSMATLDKSFFEEACHETCIFCQEQMEVIDGMVSRNDYYDGFAFDDLLVTGALEGGDSPRAEWAVQVIGYLAPHTIWRDKKNRSEVLDEFRFVGGTDLIWDDGWKVEKAGAYPYEYVYND